MVKGLDFKKQTLLLLYSCVDGKASDQEIFDWVEYSSKGMFKTRILKDLHNERLIEYDDNAGTVYISPNGVKLVEANLISV